MTAPARGVDDFLADLDDVLATSTPPIPAPTPTPEPEPTAVAPTPDTAPAPARVPDPSPGPPEKDWWSDVYKHDKADQDTFTGNTPAPVPAALPATVDDPAPVEVDEEPDEDAPEEPATEPAKAAKEKPSKPRQRPEKRRRKAKPGKPAAARTAWDTDSQSPRQSLIEAWARTPYRLKWLAYHATAAYLGWSAGLVDYSTHVTAWIASTGPTGGQAFFWYGAATCTFLLYRRTRSHWWPVAWCAAIPVTSTITGVLLYGTPHP
ncbi:hypothetical protein [Streptomyces sp. B21-083]|uniref:hypothetical protein n=1 Tax=Streptomyces sp. B21-083 TaxID=3039410 RepID=UPI002FEF0D39